MIPVYSSDSSILRNVTEDQAASLITSGQYTVVRDRQGRNRRLIERDIGDPDDTPLTREQRDSAGASYTGSVRYTYREHLGGLKPAVITMLKRIGRDRFGRETGQYVRWPQNA
jgi:hypothetical protein